MRLVNVEGHRLARFEIMEPLLECYVPGGVHILLTGFRARRVEAAKTTMDHGGKNPLIEGKQRSFDLCGGCTHTSVYG